MFDTPIDKDVSTEEAVNEAKRSIAASVKPPINAFPALPPNGEALIKAFTKQAQEHAENLTKIVQQTMTAMQAEATATKQAFLDTVARIVAETRTEKEQMQEAQGNIMHGHPPFSLRVNLTLKKLQWIARETALDPATNLPWADAYWNDVKDGDFVEVEL